MILHVQKALRRNLQFLHVCQFFFKESYAMLATFKNCSINLPVLLLPLERWWMGNLVSEWLSEWESGWMGEWRWEWHTSTLELAVRRASLALRYCCSSLARGCCSWWLSWKGWTKIYWGSQTTCKNVHGNYGALMTKTLAKLHVHTCITSCY